MSGNTATLRSLSITALNDKTSSDRAQVPLPGAQIDLYRQGATVTGSTTITAGSSATVNVESVGGVLNGDTIMVGVGGAALSVTGTNTAATPQTVTLHNASGVSVLLYPGDRLIPTNARPHLYADAHGATVLGSTVTSDSYGRVNGFLNGSPFDYTITPGAASVGTTSEATLTASTSSLTWNHPAVGPDSAIVVGIAWQENTGSETLDAVTYGGATMTHLGSTNMVDLFYLVHPPLGPQSVVATWSGSSAKGAVAAAVSLVGLDPASPFGSLYSNTGTSTSPSVTVTTSHAHGVILSVVGVNAITSTTTVTTTQALLWSDTAGTAGALTRTEGAGSATASTGLSLAASWTLGASKAWGILAVEAKPATARLVTDAEGASFGHSPLGVNAADFPTLQAAVNFLGSQGGTVFIPAGIYNPASVPAYDPPLVIPDQVNPINLIGSGRGVTTLLAAESDADMLLVQADNCTIEGITFDGTPQKDGGRGIVIGPPSARVLGGTNIVGCEVVNSSGWSIYVIGVDPENGPISIFGQFTRVRVSGPRGVPKYPEVGTAGGIFVGLGCTTQWFTDCVVEHFLGYAVDVLQSSGHSFVRCTFEDSLDEAAATRYVRLRKCFATLVSNCWFEHHAESFNTYFISLGDPADSDYFSGNVTIDTCSFNQRLAASAQIVEVCDRCREIQIRNARVTLLPPPTSTEDIKIGANCRVMIEGGEIAASIYHELQVSEGVGSQVYYVARSRVRLPKVSRAERDTLTQVGDGDTVQNLTSQQMQVHQGMNWGSFTTFQSASLLGLTGSVSDSVLVTGPIGGLYRVTAMVFVTEIKTLVDVTVTIGWGDDFGAQSTVLFTAHLDALGPTEGAVVIRAIAAGAAPNITYRTTKSAVGGEYSLYVCAERLCGDADET